MYYLQNKAKIMPKNLQETKLFKTLNFEETDLENYEKLGFATQNCCVISDTERGGYVKIDENGYLCPQPKTTLRDLFFSRFYKNKDFYEMKYTKDGKETKEEISHTKAFDLDMKEFLLTEITVGSFIFNPNKPRISVEDVFEDEIVKINRFFKTEIAKKALDERKKRKNGRLHQDLTFLDKYPHTKLFLENLFCYQCDTQKEADERLLWVLSWMSKSFVNYDKRQTAIVIHGASGTGKDTFIRVYFKRYYNEKFCAVVSNEELKSHFTSQKLETSLLCQMNEIKGDFKDGNIVFDKLKTLITEPLFKHELKGQNSVYLPNFFNIIICSNDTKPIQVSDTDRRYSVFYSGKSLKALAQEKFSCDTAQFLENLEKEADNFLVDLVCFNYDVAKPDDCLNTREVGILKEATNTKITLLAKNLVDGNIEKIKEETIENAREIWSKPDGRQDLLRIFKNNRGITDKIKDFDIFESKYFDFDYFAKEVIEAFFDRFNKIKSVQGVALSADLRTLYQINIGLAKTANEVSIKLKEHLHLVPGEFNRSQELEKYKNEYFKISVTYRGFKLWDEEIQF